MAILMQEEGLYSRCRIYATDMDEVVLKQAKAGIFSLKRMQDYTQNYQQAGGTRSFSEYYTSGYEYAIFSSSLKQNLVFFNTTYQEMVLLTNSMSFCAAMFSSILTEYFKSKFKNCFMKA